MEYFLPAREDLEKLNLGALVSVLCDFILKQGVSPVGHFIDKPNFTGLL